MKKHIIAIMVGSSLFGGFMGAANAADGTINFSGSLTADACKVDTTSQNQTVTLGNVATTAFAAKGDKASPTKFDLKLTDCPATVSSTVVKFDGTADAADSSLLALNSDATASGVGIEIANDAGVAIPLHQASEAFPLVEGANTLNFVARYKSDADAVVAGTANSVSQFTLNYN